MAVLRVDMTKEEVGAALGAPSFSKHHGINQFDWQYEFRNDGYMWDRYHDERPIEQVSTSDGRKVKSYKYPGWVFLKLHFEEDRLVSWAAE